MNYSHADKSSNAALCIAYINYPLIKARFYTSFLHFYTHAKTGGGLILTDERRGEIITAAHRETE